MEKHAKEEGQEMEGIKEERKEGKMEGNKEGREEEGRGGRKKNIILFCKQISASFKRKARKTPHCLEIRTWRS